jgi:TonB family protein
MATPVAYRVPRRFIAPPDEPPPYGLFAVSLVGHVVFFVVAFVVSAILGVRIDQAKIYVVNLVPAAPIAGAPTPGPVAPRPAERTPPNTEPVRAEPRTPPPPEVPVAKAEVRTPPALEAPDPPSPKAEVRTPPPPRVARVDTPPPPREVTPPRPAPEPLAPLAPPKLPEIARVTPQRSPELALPRRVEKESPALDVPGARDRLLERTLPPPPSAAPRLPEAPRVLTPQGAPAVPTPGSSGPSGMAGLRPPVEPARLGRPNVGVGSTGSISLDVSDFPFTYYLRQIQAKVSERWAPPRAATRGGERATIMFEIGRDGTIKEPSLEKGSGITLFDQSALRAVAEASPFPPLPPEFKERSLRIHLGFEFHPDQG